jgi:hypothetical protein
MVMHRLAILVSLLVVLSSLAVGGSRRDALAQDATPAGQTLEGVSVVPLAVAPGVSLPPSPATVVLTRYEIAPGASQVTDATDPALAIITQESGTGTIRLEAATMVTRGATGAPEEVPAGTDFTLEPGDSFVWPAFVAGEARNDGTEPVVALVVVIVPEAAATPTP